MIVMILILLATTNSFINEFRREQDIDKNKDIAIIYMEMIDCVKCYIEPMEMADFLTQNYKNIELFAAVNCDREIELKVFKRDKSWKYKMFIDEDRKTRSKLSGGEEIYMTIIKANGETKHFTKSREQNTTQENIKRVKEFMK
jgi:hypothetical protein